MMMQRQMMMGPRPENMDNINMKAYKEYQNMLAMGQMNNPQMQQGNQRGQNPYQYLQCYQNQYITAGNRDQANGNMPINSGPPPNFRAIQSGDYPKDGPSTADNRFSDSNYQQMNPFPWAVRNAQPDEQQMRMNMPNHNGSNSNANMTSNSISNFGGSDSILGSMSSLFGNNLDSLASLSGLMESGSMPVIRDNQESRKDLSSNAGNDNSGGRSVHSHSTQGCKGIEDEVGYPIDDNPESDKKDKSLGSKRKIDEALSRSEIDKNGIGGKAPTSSARVAPIDSSFDKSMLTASSSMYSEGSAPRSDGRVVIPSVPVHMLRENPKPDKGSAAEMNSLQSKKSSDKKASASDKVISYEELGSLIFYQ